MSPEPDCVLPGYHVRDLAFAQRDGDYLHPERFSREFKRAQVRYNRDNRDNPDEPVPPMSRYRRSASMPSATVGQPWYSKPAFR